MSGDLIDTTEMYLKTIYELAEEGIVPLRARIAERLGHSGPTVSQTVGRMERDGLVVVNDDRHLELTAEGWRIATRVMRKHRLAERLLTDIIGLELPHVHDEACRWEHVMSERVEKRVLELLGEPAVSPYGNHIPGLEELGIEPASAGQQPSHELSVLEAMESDVTSATLVRIGENPQTLADFLAIAVEIGLLPGASVTLERHDERISISTDRGTVEIPGDAARHLFVVQGSK